MGTHFDVWSSPGLSDLQALALTTSSPRQCSQAIRLLLISLTALPLNEGALRFAHCATSQITCTCNRRRCCLEAASLLAFTQTKPSWLSVQREHFSATTHGAGLWPRFILWLHSPGRGSPSNGIDISSWRSVHMPGSDPKEIGQSALLHAWIPPLSSSLKKYHLGSWYNFPAFGGAEQGLSIGRRDKSLRHGKSVLAKYGTRHAGERDIPVKGNEIDTRSPSLGSRSMIAKARSTIVAHHSSEAAAHRA